MSMNSLTESVMKLSIDYAREVATNKALREEIEYLRKLLESQLTPTHTEDGNNLTKPTKP